MCCTIPFEASRMALLSHRACWCNLDFAAARHYMVADATRFEIANLGREMARTPVMAAGGIVLRREQTPLIAVVRLRKRNEWVLPKGKLDDGETPRAAAEREAMEETGHAGSVHEFQGRALLAHGGGRRAGSRADA